ERADPGTQSVLTSGRDGRRGRRALRPLRAGSLTSARRRLLPAAIRLFPACDPRCVTHRSRTVNDTLISLHALVVSGATLPGLASALIPPGRFPWETPIPRWRERMRLKRNKLRDAIAMSLAVSAVTLAGSGAALAQETEETQPQQSATVLDAVTVTGTRIKSQTMTAASPVVEISAEEFRFAGATTVEIGRASCREGVEISAAGEA